MNNPITTLTLTAAQLHLYKAALVDAMAVCLYTAKYADTENWNTTAMTLLEMISLLDREGSENQDE